MAGVCLLSSASGTLTFASGTKKASETRKFEHQVSRNKILDEKIAVQKAFLVALLCSLNTEVYIKFRKDYKSKNLDFTVYGTKESTLADLSSRDNMCQMKFLIETLKSQKDLIDFDCDVRVKNFTLNCVRINNYFLTKPEIDKIGEKILDLLYKKKNMALLDHTISDLTNINEDISLRQEMKDILGKILDGNPSTDENLLKFYTPNFDNSSKKRESIINIDHINYIKAHPDDSYSVICCYHKAFFAGILSALGIDTRVKRYSKIPGEFPNCLSLYKINEKRLCYRKTLSSHLINVVNSIFPPEKMNIAASSYLYNSFLTKVTIEDITLDEVDIFNLGKRFYDLAQPFIDSILNKNSLVKVISLDRFSCFTENIKKAFKQYTGKDLPNLKS